VGGEYDDLTREAGRPTPLEQLISSSLHQFQPLHHSPDLSEETESPDSKRTVEKRPDRAGARR